MIALPWWYVFKSRVRRWFWQGLLRRPVKWRNWATRYTLVDAKGADEKMRRAIRNTEWKKPELRNPVTRSIPIFAQLESRQPERSFYGNVEEKP